MGVAFIYGERQASLPAISQLSTLEYDVAKTIGALVRDTPQKVIGYTTGHGEPDLGTSRGPLEDLREASRRSSSGPREVPRSGSPWPVV